METQEGSVSSANLILVGSDCPHLPPHCAVQQALTASKLQTKCWVVECFFWSAQRPMAEIVTWIKTHNKCSRMSAWLIVVLANISLLNATAKMWWSVKVRQQRSMSHLMAKTEIYRKAVGTKDDLADEFFDDHKEAHWSWSFRLSLGCMRHSTLPLHQHAFLQVKAKNDRQTKRSSGELMPDRRSADQKDSHRHCEAERHNGAMMKAPVAG